jgi:hypothetical protein
MSSPSCACSLASCVLSLSRCDSLGEEPFRDGCESCWG